MKRKPSTFIGNGCGKLAKMMYSGFGEYLKKLNEIEGKSKEIAKTAVYDGADIVTDQIRTNIDTINNIHGYQKQDLKDSLGIAPMVIEIGGGINTKVGWDGYGSVPTEKYPKGLPNQLLARSVESGTSFRSKTPFVRRAVNKTKKPAIQAMQDRIDEEMKKIMEE